LKTKLIYISGGDQTRFMNIVQNTPIYTTIHDAYKAEVPLLELALEQL
jgi:cyanophycinase